MRFPIVRAATVGLLVIGLAGCNTIKGWFGKGDKTAEAGEPAELVDFEPAFKPERLWRESIGKGEQRLWLRQAPAVAEGRVYTADASGRVKALALETGREVWAVKSKLRYSTSPGVGAGYVVVGTMEGQVVALDADTGGERWSVRVLSEVASRPLISEGLAIVRSSDGRVYGLDLADGRRRWVFARGLPALTVRGNGAPVLGQGVVYVGYDDGTVVALRAQDGLRVWERSVAEPEGRSELDRMADVDGELAVGLDAVFAASFKGRLAALTANGGSPVWNRELKSATGVALARDRVLAVDVQGDVWALDRNNGNAVWRQDALAMRWLSSPAVQGEHAVVGDLEGYLHWLRLDSGDFVARIKHGGDPIRATPQVSPEGILVVVDTDGRLAAYRIGGG